MDGQNRLPEAASRILTKIYKTPAVWVVILWNVADSHRLESENAR